MKLFQVIMLMLFTATSTVQNAALPKAIELPKTVTASEVQSLRFRNSLLEIQSLRSQADAMTSRANLLQGTLTEQIAVIMKEGKIDGEKYAIIRSASGAFILSDDGLLQFQLREVKKD